MREEPRARGSNPNACFFGIPGKWEPAGGPRTLQIALVGGNGDAVLAGVRDGPASAVCLISTPSEEARARSLLSTLREADVPTRIQVIPDERFATVAAAIGEIADEARLTFTRIAVNVSTGTREGGCAALTAAYLHGLGAFAVVDGTIVTVPVLPLPVRDVLAEDQLRVLRAIAGRRRARSVRRLARAVRLDAAAALDALAGTPVRRGLCDLGLVERRAAWFGPRYALTAAGLSLLAIGLPDPMV